MTLLPLKPKVGLACWVRFGSLVEALNLISPVVFPRCQVKEYYLINNKYRYSTKVLLLPATGSADGRFLHIINMRRTLPTLELPILTELNLEARCTYHTYLSLHRHAWFNRKLKLASQRWDWVVWSSYVLFRRHGRVTSDILIVNATRVV